MQEIKVFESVNFGSIRVVERDGEPWFVAKDVCQCLEIDNHKDAMRRLDADEKAGVVLTDPHGRPQETNCVSEPGLYSLVLSSRKPGAKAFKRWIVHEVIPAIRKTGAYMTPEKVQEALLNPDTIINLALQIKELQEEARKNEPNVLLAKSITASDECILIRDLAKLLRQNGVQTGEQRLFKTLRDDKYLLKDNSPSQRAMELGLFEVTERVIMQYGKQIVSRTTKVTGKGQHYFINKYLTQGAI